MATAHIESLESDISELVLMPGDPLRAKYIADKFLTDVKIVNKVRNMFAYTGFYKDKRITVFPSGMGIPSIGIYAFELYKFYNVKRIIRIGTSGTMDLDVKIMDVVLSSGAKSKSSFSELLDGIKCNYCESSSNFNYEILNKAKDLNIKCHYGKTITSDVFDPYCDDKTVFEKQFEDDKYLACEMEAFALFYLAKKLNKEASCLMTIVDSKFDDRVVTSEEREKSLDDMITIALESI